MDKATITLRAVEAGKQLLGREIVIQSSSDFTPAGKRVVRVVRYARSGRRTAAQLRWYVGGNTFRSLALTNENLELSNAWKASDPRLAAGF